jgi:hypothetical protein
MAGGAQNGTDIFLSVPAENIKVASSTMLRPCPDHLSGHAQNNDVEWDGSRLAGRHIARQVGQCPPTPAIRRAHSITIP